MTEHRFRRVVPTHELFPARRDDQGRHLCRFCGAICPGRRTSFCSQQCVDGFWIATSPQSARRAVEKRDRGVCALCGLDTGRLDRVLRGLRNRASPYRKTRTPQTRWFLAALERMRSAGFNITLSTHVTWVVWRHLWEADHILPVVEGGGGIIRLDNLRTLCVPCHKQQTRELAKRRAIARRKQGELF